MRPRPDQVLGLLVQTLLVDIAPAVSGDYGQRSAQLAAMLLGMVQEQWDGAVEGLVAENGELCAIFREALPLLGDAGLRQRLEEALAADRASLRLTRLYADNDRLRGLLVELHAWLEERSEPRALELVERIWRELAASTERRRLTLSPF